MIELPTSNVTPIEAGDAEGEQRVREGALCACGCGERIAPKRHHRWLPARFIQGHYQPPGRALSHEVSAWLSANRGRLRCGCGCGGVLKLTRAHFRRCPRFLPGHQPLADQHWHWSPNRGSDRRLGQDFPPSAKVAIYERCGGRCVRCATGDDLEYDHVVPVSAGGSWHAENGRLLCSRCHRMRTDITVALRALERHLARLLQRALRTRTLIEEWDSKWPCESKEIPPCP